MPAMTGRTLRSAVACGLLVGFCLGATLAAACPPPAPESRQNETAPQDAEALRLAAEQGNADAQYNLAVMYANGLGVPQDDAEAVRWYRRAADQGMANAQAALGFRYGIG